MYEAYPRTTARTKSGRHNGQPLRIIRKITLKPMGIGHVRIFTLDCGHKLEHIGFAQKKVGGRMCCPECKEKEK